MTITEIAVDLIRERDQLKKRIRELERRLEEFTPEDIRGMAYDANALLEQRIAKAREILEEYERKPLVTLGDIGDMVRCALDALEGK